jgi:hypothetical protein
LEHGIIKDWRRYHLTIGCPGDFPSGNSSAKQSLNEILDGIAPLDAGQLGKPSSQPSTATSGLNERFSQLSHGEALNCTGIPWRDADR